MESLSREECEEQEGKSRYLKSCVSASAEGPQTEGRLSGLAEGVFRAKLVLLFWNSSNKIINGHKSKSR